MVLSKVPTYKRTHRTLPTVETRSILNDDHGSLIKVVCWPPILCVSIGIDSGLFCSKWFVQVASI